MYNERAHLYRRTEYRKMNALANIFDISDICLTEYKVSG